MDYDQVQGVKKFSRPEECRQQMCQRETNRQSFAVLVDKDPHRSIPATDQCA